MGSGDAGMTPGGFAGGLSLDQRGQTDMPTYDV